MLFQPEETPEPVKPAKEIQQKAEKPVKHEKSVCLLLSLQDLQFLFYHTGDINDSRHNCRIFINWFPVSE